MGKGIVTEEQLAAFFLGQAPEADAVKVARLAAYYVEEADAEGINSDIAFADVFRNRLLAIWRARNSRHEQFLRTWCN